MEGNKNISIYRIIKITFIAQVLFAFLFLGIFGMLIIIGFGLSR